MNKIIMIVVTLLVSCVSLNFEESTKVEVYADEAAAPVTLTKEAESAVDCRQDEESVPNTGDRTPVPIAIGVVVAVAAASATTVRTTTANHKNS